MNYSELLDNVRNYTEVTSDVLSNSVINVFLTNIENQIDRLIDTDAQRRYATTTFTANNSFLAVTLVAVNPTVAPVRVAPPAAYVPELPTSFVAE